MKRYLKERQQTERTARVIGLALAGLAHVLAATLLVFTGIKYIYPPPPETTFLLDFSEEQEPVKTHFRGVAPRSEEPDRTKPVELVQRSESPYQTTAKTNPTPATRPDDFGDIETPTPEPKEEVLDPRASFPGMSKKDTSITAPHGARESSATFKAGQPGGNTDTGRTDGSPNAHLKGRSAKGSLPRPRYNVQESGVVVVSIWVDNYGNVVKAQAGAQGTTVTDKTLWAEARSAALGAKFNPDADAPALQEGTITYVFKLK